MYISFSAALEQRLWSHHLFNGMKTSSKPRRLVLSSLVVLGIEMDVHRTRVVKTWKKEQFPLAESIIIMLSSSLLDDMGFNCSQGTTRPKYISTVADLTLGGTSKDGSDKRRAVKYTNAPERLFLDHSWRKDNLASTKAEAEAKNAGIATMQGFSDQMLSLGISDVKQARSNLKKLDIDNRDTQTLLTSTRTVLEAEIEKVGA